MFQPLDGPSDQSTLSVGTVTVVAARVGGSNFAERNIVTLQGDGKFYVYFGDGSTPSAATVAADGFTQFKDQMASHEATDSQDIWLLSLSGTINIKVAERA